MRLAIKAQLYLADSFYKCLSTKFLSKKIKEKKGVLILMYHSVPPAETRYLYSTLEKNFKEQIDFLAENFNVVSLKTAVELLKEGNLSDKNPYAVITFDDGYKNNYSVAYPLLKSQNLPFTIFLTTNFIDSNYDTFLDWNEVRRMDKDSLVTFGAHTKSHLSLHLLEKKDLEQEIVGSKKKIEAELQKEIDLFAYPSGSYNDQALQIVQENFRAAVKDRIEKKEDKDQYKLARLSIDKKTESFKDFLISLLKAPFLN